MMDPCPDTSACKACDRFGRTSQLVTHHCTDCDEHMCKYCIVAHDRFLKCQHTKLTLDEYHSSGISPRKKTKVGGDETDAKVCKNHSETNTNLICQDCKQFLCKDCLNDTKCSENLNHKHNSEVVADLQQNSEGSVSPLLDKAKCALAEANGRLEALNGQIKAVEASFEDMVSRRSQCVQQLSEVCGEKNRIVSQRAERLKAQFNKDKHQIESRILELTELVSKPPMALDSDCSIGVVEGPPSLGNTALLAFKTAKFEHYRTQAPESLAAHINSAVGFSVEHKTIIGSNRVNDAVYAKKLDAWFLGCQDGIHYLQEDRPGIEKKVLQVNNKGSHRLCLSKDEKMLFSSTFDRTIKVFTIGGKGDHPHKFDIRVPRGYSQDLNWPSVRFIPRRTFEEISLSPDGKVLALSDYHNIIRVIDLDGDQLYNFKMGKYPSVTFLDDNVLCVTYSEDGVYFMAGILLTQSDPDEEDQLKGTSSHGPKPYTDWYHKVLWEKQLRNIGRKNFFSNGMIFARSCQKFLVLHPPDNWVDELACPEGDPVGVCTMGDGTITAISYVFRT